VGSRDVAGMHSKFVSIGFVVFMEWQWRQLCVGMQTVCVPFASG